MAKVAAAGISWFNREDYPRILEIMVDAHIFPAGYDAWKKRAESDQARAEARGLRVIRVIVDPDEFIVWCASQRMPLDANARRLFAASGAMRAQDH